MRVLSLKMFFLWCLLAKVAYYWITKSIKFRYQNVNNSYTKVEDINLGQELYNLEKENVDCT